MQLASHVTRRQIEYIANIGPKLAAAVTQTPSLSNQLGTQMLKTATVTPLAMLVIGMILTKINGSIE